MLSSLCFLPPAGSTHIYSCTYSQTEHAAITPPFVRNKLRNACWNIKTIGYNGISHLHGIHLNWRVDKLTESNHSASPQVTVCGAFQPRANEGTAAWVRARNEVFADVRCILCQLELPVPVFSFSPSSPRSNLVPSLMISPSCFWNGIFVLKTEPGLEQFCLMFLTPILWEGLLQLQQTDTRRTFWPCYCWGNPPPCLHWNLPSWPVSWSAPAVLSSQGKAEKLHVSLLTETSTEC